LPAEKIKTIKELVSNLEGELYEKKQMRCRVIPSTFGGVNILSSVVD